MLKNWPYVTSCPCGSVGKYIYTMPISIDMHVYAPLHLEMGDADSVTYIHV